MFTVAVTAVKTYWQRKCEPKKNMSLLALIYVIAFDTKDLSTCPRKLAVTWDIPVLHELRDPDVKSINREDTLATIHYRETQLLT